MNLGVHCIGMLRPNIKRSIETNAQDGFGNC